MLGFYVFFMGYARLPTDYVVVLQWFSVWGGKFMHFVFMMVDCDNTNLMQFIWLSI